ncbi:MAG: OmpH family outer membrane protein [Bacteroidales bacterium]|nr:OmpH family outer membrane protein [Bacteroidales bacterium]
MKKVILLAVAAFAGLTAFAQPKFAHVNFTELIQLMPEADQARTTMTASSKEAQDTYQAMVDEFQTKYSTYQQNAGTWTQVIRETKEKELTDIQQRIQEFSQSVEQELAQQQQQLFAPIQQKAIETVNTLAKEGGYVYVFDKTSVLYIDEAQSADLTPAARKALGIADDRTLESLQQELAAQQQAQ